MGEDGGEKGEGKKTEWRARRCREGCKMWRERIEGRSREVKRKIGG